MFDKRAMLVELTVRQWTAKKHDKSVSREVDKLHAADRGGRYNKQLIAKEELDAIAKQATAIRTFHYARTLPWGNNGQRLLPVKLFMEYRADLVKLVAKFNEHVRDFLAKYPQLVSDARARLGTLYDPAEYPLAHEIHRSFGIEFDFFPVPTAGDFRVDVAAEERSQLQAQIEEATTERQKAATKACYVRVKDVLERMKNQCVPGKTRITDSLMDNARELVGVLDALNIGNDPELEHLRQEIQRELIVDTDDLRNSPATRKIVGDKAAELLDSISWS